jgi:hypothetical protein
MNEVTGNSMNLQYFQDFYYLEALQAGITMAKSANPELAFHHSVERLEHDVEIALSNLAHNIALRVYVYLWAAALGEARHASNLCRVHVKQLKNAGRDTCYTQSLQYFPSDKNVEIITKIYTQEWNSGAFGGEAWLDIVEGMKLYGKVPHIAFIDHAIDLEHNGGSVFSKHTPNIRFNVYEDCYDATNLRTFLNFKFAQNILKTTNHRTIRVMRKTYSLVTRYSNIIERIEAVDFLSPELETLSDYSVEWDYKEFELSGEIDINGKAESRRDFDATCEMCHRQKMHSYDHEHISGNCVCDDCYRRYEDYGRCENCGCLTRNTSYVEGENEDWCESCIENYAVQCEDCGHDFHSSHIEWSKDGHALCYDCQKEYVCVECFEVHYNDMEEHVQTHQPKPTELNVDSDGVFEAIYTWDWIDEAKTTILYSWRGLNYHTVETSNVNEQIESLKSAGCKYFAVAKVKTFGIAGGAYSNPTKTNVTLTVYEIPDTCLFVYNKQDAEKLLGGNDKNVGFGIMTKTGLHFQGNKQTLDEQITIANNLKNVINWNEINTLQDWQKLSETTVNKIKKVVYGG